MVWPSRKTGWKLNILVLELGITPALASSGKNVLEILEALPVDVVISDLSMPEMDGVQLSTTKGASSRC